ncbi:hypothetical protein [Gordonia sp. VNK21]|uniref:hypothetical protein n=1 Tax=Gordonia sp. VNK21 TaxID=3382483 RepID=UPI0038D4F5FD
MTKASPASGSAGLPEPPFSIELLADYYAGALGPELTAHITDQLPADPAGRRVLAALDATRIELGASRPTPAPAEMPDAVTRRIDDLLGGLGAP